MTIVPECAECVEYTFRCTDDLRKLSCENGDQNLTLELYHRADHMRPSRNTFTPYILEIDSEPVTMV